MKSYRIEAMTDERCFRLRPWRWNLPARLLWALVRYGHDAEKLSSVVDHILQSYRVQTTDLKWARKAKDRFDALSIAAGQTRAVAGIAMEFGVFKGTFATKVPSFEDQKNISLEVGRIEVTLPEFLRRAPQPISLVHIDCPFYDINILILERGLPFMAPGSVVVFDEYYGYLTYEDHEFKAWLEMRSRFELGVVPIAYSSRSAGFLIEHNPRYAA